MRFSACYIPTMKEAPAEAEVVSHKLLIRAGMIRRLASGVYNYLPVGLKALTKISRIVREEMDRAGSLEILMPAVQPGDLWQESGRWEQYGKELLRFTDRHDRNYCLGPTHEEVVTDLLRREVRSYRQLPISLYQVQAKFRDEIRPRFGLMRGREFLMKDAYTFDRDDDGADVSYRTMFEAYIRVFDRLGLRYRYVEADSGSIGGSFSHEFMVLAQTGEDTIVACKSCQYAANVERAELLPVGEGAGSRQDAPPAIEEVSTPGQHTVGEVTSFMKIGAQALIKTILLDVDGEPVAALVRGDRELNEIKIKNRLNADNVQFASPAQVEAWTGAPVGFAGPVGLAGLGFVKRILADFELAAREGWVTGANKKDAHLANVSLERDVPGVEYADIRKLVEGDPCPRCGGEIETMRGIEVGHVFKLGTKYSEAMNAMYTDENGDEHPIIMGCYGIGVSRVLAACIEQNHDDNGIIFPPPVAPYEVFIANLDPGNGDVNGKADEIYGWLKDSGLDVLLDDRDERPGVKFKDADLLGAPMQLVIGGKGLSRGIIEAKDRRSGEKTELAVDGFKEAFTAWMGEVRKGWEL